MGACRGGETKQPGGYTKLQSEDLYPNVATVLTILLTMPVSTATPERSFSTMRRVKTVRAVHYADRATIISSSYMPYARIQGDAD